MSDSGAPLIWRQKPKVLPIFLLLKIARMIRTVAWQNFSIVSTSVVLDSKFSRQLTFEKYSPARRRALVVRIEGAAAKKS